MSDYTFKCSECNVEITFTEYRETPTYELHFSQDEENGELLYACNGELQRIWKPITFTVKGKGYNNSEIE